MPRTVIPGLTGSKKRLMDASFSELPHDARLRAQAYLWKWLQKWGSDMPNWRRAILVGKARRLALFPLDSAWAKRMRCGRGGKATYQRHGAIGHESLLASGRTLYGTLKEARERKARESAPKATLFCPFPDGQKGSAQPTVRLGPGR